RLLVPIPLLLLVWACARPTDARLLFGFPFAVAVCAALGAGASAVAAPAPALILSAAALVAYLLAAARLAQATSWPAPVVTQPLAETVRDRPGRRTQMPIVLAGFALIAPATLLYAALLRPGADADLARAFPDRPAAAALVVCGAAALWVGLAVVYVLGALSTHLAT